MVTITGMMIIRMDEKVSECRGSARRDMERCLKMVYQLVGVMQCSVAKASAKASMSIIAYLSLHDLLPRRTRDLDVWETSCKSGV